MASYCRITELCFNNESDVDAYVSLYRNSVAPETLLLYCPVGRQCLYRWKAFCPGRLINFSKHPICYLASWLHGDRGMVYDDLRAGFFFPEGHKPLIQVEPSDFQPGRLELTYDIERDPKQRRRLFTQNFFWDVDGETRVNPPMALDPRDAFIGGMTAKVVRP